MSEFEGKAAIVTGATGGIGPAIAHHLVGAGAALLLGRTQPGRRLAVRRRDR